VHSSVQREALDALDGLVAAQLALLAVGLPSASLELHQEAHKSLEVPTSHHPLEGSALLAYAVLLLALLQLLEALAAVVGLSDYWDGGQCHLFDLANGAAAG
jgi:hypothetical protein